MKRRTKLLSVTAAALLLAISLASIVHVYINNDNIGEGGEKDFTGYIDISSAEELAMIGNDAEYPLDAKYYLTCNILFDADVPDNFEPIGSWDNPFTGIFDGNDYVISGLNILVESHESAYAGVFASVQDAEIRDLGIKNSLFAAKSSKDAYAGGLVGNILGSTVIENCYSTAPVSASSNYNAYAGGLAGSVSGSATISGCFSSGSTDAITSSPDQRAFAGGMVGYKEATDDQKLTIIDCYNTGPVNAMTETFAAGVYAGGIIGDIYIRSSGSVTIENCYNTGSIAALSSDNAHSGGIVGHAYIYQYGSMEVRNCYNTAQISSISNKYADAGGIVGFTETTSSGTMDIAVCFNTGRIASSSQGVDVSAGGIAGRIYTMASAASAIADCYNTGNVFSSSVMSVNARAGGIAGYVYTSSAAAQFSNCYSNGQISSTNASYIGGIVGRAYTYDGTTSAINCYFLQGTASSIGSPLTVDGTSSPARKTSGPDQRSGAKTALTMKPDIGNILAPNGGNSIYYTGTTNGVPGWDFINVWTIDGNINDGYPILRIFTGMSVAFTIEPEDMTVKKGETAVFTCNAAVTPIMIPQYQWYVSTDGGDTWNRINGAIGRSYVFGPAAEEDDGTLFMVTATTPGLSVSTVSRTATLHIAEDAPEIPDEGDGPGDGGETGGGGEGPGDGPGDGGDTGGEGPGDGEETGGGGEGPGDGGDAGGEELAPEPSSFGLIAFAAAAAALLALGGFLFFIWKRRKDEEEEE